MSPLYAVLQIGVTDESKAVMTVAEHPRNMVCPKKSIVSLLLQAIQLSLVTCKIILAELFAVYQLYQEILSFRFRFFQRLLTYIPKYFY